MKFNAKKFQVLRYGKNEELKNNTMYFTENTSEIVQREETVRDLGVLLSDDGRFKKHLEKVVGTVRQKTGWVLRTFQSRSPFLMKTLYKTLIIPHLDYCSQLWSPIKKTEIHMLEKLQKDFFNRVPALKNLSYWEKLEFLQMYSIERRLERYRIIYAWKILESRAPDCGIMVTHTEESRLGRRCGPRQTIRRGGDRWAQTFQVQAPRLFNATPKHVRNLTKCSTEDFKKSLDEYLSSVYDEPAFAGCVPRGIGEDGRASNSVIHQMIKTGERGRMRRPGT